MFRVLTNLQCRRIFGDRWRVPLNPCMVYTGLVVKIRLYRKRACNIDDERTPEVDIMRTSWYYLLQFWYYGVLISTNQGEWIYQLPLFWHWPSPFYVDKIFFFMMGGMTCACSMSTVHLRWCVCLWPHNKMAKQAISIAAVSKVRRQLCYYLWSSLFITIASTTHAKDLEWIELRMQERGIWSV